MGELDELRARVASLEATLERERALFAGGPVVVFRWVATEGWPVEYVSSNVESVFGYTAEELTSGRVSYGAVVHPEDVARVAAEVAEHSAAGETAFEQDYRIVDAEGAVRWLYDYTVVVRDEAGVVTHYAGYVLDVSARREAEADSRRKDELLRQAQKMEALGRLAGGIAHDFNNLLTAIVGHAEQATHLLPPGPAAQPAREPLDRIGALVDRASALTRQLLAFARRQVLAPRVVDLGIVVADARSLLEPALGSRVVVEIKGTGDPLWVRVDPGQAEQVVVNLLLNARDAMSGSGRIVVRVEARVITEPLPGMLDDRVPPGEYAVLTVTDSGVGISPSTLPRVFEPFYTTKAEGTGLGLATVYGIVRQSSGHVLVRSAPGCTSFEVWLPKVEAPRGSDRAARPTSGRSLEGHERVLLVEDDEEIRSIAARALTARGYTVVTARDGDEALGLVQAGEMPDVVCTDLAMPRLGGTALVDALEEVGLHIPALFVSGYADSAVPSWSNRRYAFVHKPYTTETLLRALRGLLDGDRVA